jgi:exodeoxyribonuclease V alpha subunit
MSMPDERLETGDLDRHLASLCLRLGAGDDPLLTHSLRLACRVTAAGHICVTLAEWSGKPLPSDESGAVRAPSVEQWGEALWHSPVVGRPGDIHPFILDEAGRLYLYRYWAYEQALAADLLARIADPPTVDLAGLRQALDGCFPPRPDGEPDRQRTAAAVAVLQRLAVICGGPGTGKTSTIVRILGLLLSLGQVRPGRILLAAPTGKAAARMQDAIRASRAALPISEPLRDAIPVEAATLHRLLGFQPGSVRFRHDRDNPLPADVVVVDEASMVDLALMAKLVRAVPPRARLILLGDKDQLASVEAGAVLGDLCGGPLGCSSEFQARLRQTASDPGLPGGTQTGPGIHDCLVELDRSYRFGAASGIGRLARLINQGAGREARTFLERGDSPDVVWRPVASARDLADRLAGEMDFAPLLTAATPELALDALDRVRLLAAHRGARFGVRALNARIEDLLAARGLIRPASAWYRGRPVLVTANDYNLRLFNGDLGVAQADGDAGCRVFFRGEQGVRRFPPARLPQHDTAFAMTVHRSQGSEAEEVVLVLPSELTPVLTRELLYTAVTRARRRIQIWGTGPVVEAAVTRRLTRSSGLRDALWGSRSGPEPRQP